jgi:membrane protease YdiL (CAAX protease family)
MAATLRGFGPGGILAALVVFFASGLLGPLRALPTLAWAWRSGTPWPEIGYARPRHPWRDALIGTLGGGALKLAMKALVMPLLGAPPVNPVFHFLAGNTAALPGAVLTIIAGSGIGEETQFRGFLFERLGRLLGAGPGARVVVVVITAVVFGLSHWPDQGLTGTEQALIVGLVLGGVYSRIGRLWPLMWAHAAFNLTALVIVYFDREQAVAHWIFH